MRFSRSGLLLCFFLLYALGWTQTGTQSASDPQAVAVVQAAIAALGGSTTISQAQSWTFRAHMQGPYANGSVTYSMSTDTTTGTVTLPNGSTRAAPASHSHFLPALVGAILVKESQDPEFTILNTGSSTLDSDPVTVITFAIGSGSIPVQIWYFNGSNLPVLVDFKLPGEIGARRSLPLVLALSNYQVVSGVLYPFTITAVVPGKSRQITNIQSISTGTTAPPNAFTGQAGDLP